jgi:hypothetical protein
VPEAPADHGASIAEICINNSSSSRELIFGVHEAWTWLVVNNASYDHGHQIELVIWSCYIVYSKYSTTRCGEPTEADTVYCLFFDCDNLVMTIATARPSFKRPIASTDHRPDSPMLSSLTMSQMLQVFVYHSHASFICSGARCWPSL